jgi:hypothetical protein
VGLYSRGQYYGLASGAVSIISGALSLLLHPLLYSLGVLGVMPPREALRLTDSSGAVVEGSMVEGCIQEVLTMAALQEGRGGGGDGQGYIEPWEQEARPTTVLSEEEEGTIERRRKEHQQQAQEGGGTVPASMPAGVKQYRHDSTLDLHEAVLRNGM